MAVRPRRTGRDRAEAAGPAATFGVPNERRALAKRSASLVHEMTAAVSRTLSLAVRANEIRRQGPQPDRQPRRDRRRASTWLARHGRHGRRDQLTHPQATGDVTP